MFEGLINHWRNSRLSLIIICGTVILSCQKGRQTFNHSIDSKERPWTSKSFDISEQKFSFVVHGDLTGGEREGVFSDAIKKINLLRPEFIVNVVDLIEGAEKDSLAWVSQWESFDARAMKARAPLFYAGGNHDLTGNLGQDIWKARYGRAYYHFIYKNTMFLILDSEDHGTEGHDRIEKLRNEAVALYKEEGPEAFSKTPYAQLPEREWGRIGREQSQYFIDIIEQNPDVNWVFLLVHKPVWENPDAHDFFKIEQALGNLNYAVFYGHTHVYNYSKRVGKDYINLATTGGEQFPEKGFSEDHVLWVTVDSAEVSIANILLSGLLAKDEITSITENSINPTSSKFLLSTKTEVQNVQRYSACLMNHTTNVKNCRSSWSRVRCAFRSSVQRMNGMP